MDHPGLEQLARVWELQLRSERQGLLVRDPELSVHRLQYPDPDRDFGTRDRGIDQPLLPGAGHCAGSADFPVLCHASGQRGVVDQYDP